MNATTKKASALDPALLAGQMKEVQEAKEAGEDPKIPKELQHAIQMMVQEQLKGGRERAGHRSKTLSVKLEPDLYKRFSRARFETERSGQDIFVEAIEQWFRKNKF